MIAAVTGATTYGELRRWGAQRLQEAGIESAAADARLLLLHATKFGAAKLIAIENASTDQDLIVDYGRLVDRRLSGMPVARIVGEKEFWSMRFALSAETLVPRPETEIVVEAALHAVQDRTRAISVLDLGTGSGVILAALLREFPNARGLAIDKSEPALQVARENLRNLSLGDRVSYLCSDWSSALGGTFDLIVSNPPYIASNELALLSPEVRDHDPRLALEAGAEGLDAYRIIVNQLPARLAPAGVAVLELGHGQEQAVAGLVRTTGVLTVAGPARKDLAGIPRALVIQAKG